MEKDPHSPGHRNRLPLPRRGSRAAHFLKLLALGAGIATVSLIAPQSGALIVRELIRGYVRKKRFEKQRFLRDLKNLQQRELIKFEDLGGGNVRIVLTERGKRKTLLYNLENIQLKRPKRWDRKWRLVMFDIPHHHKIARDALRRKLLELEFYHIQKSVFISPYPCADEIDFIAEVFGVRRNILLLSVDGFEGEEKLRHYFKLPS